ncbi:MAG: lipopolysaccharide transport periplasmic protein LptA [Cellvibrionaceae bacterium]
MKISNTIQAIQKKSITIELKSYKNFFIRVFLCSTLLLTSILSHALPSDKEEKIYISMQGKMQIDGANERAIYSKNVIVSQGTLKIMADQLELYGSVNNPEKIIAIGSPAKLQQQPSIDQALIIVTGNTIVYSVATGKVEIITGAQFEQNGTTIQASKIFYDVSNSYIEANADENDINVVIPPKKDQTQHEQQTNDTK